MNDCRNCLHKVCDIRPNCHNGMRNCMTTETYVACSIIKCRKCDIRMACDMATWVQLGGSV
jgi:hypothetical protein